jgi:hypothetical protein
MSVTMMVDGSAVREAITQLKEIDPKLYTALRRDMRNELAGLASGIEASFPVAGDKDKLISGLNGRGRTSYVKPTASVMFTPGVARRGRVSTLIGIRAKIPANQVGAKIAEFAGMRGVVRMDGESRTYTGPLGEPKVHKLNGQGAYLIDRLNRRSPLAGRGGRFGWKYFNSQKDDVREKGIRILERAVLALNMEK